MARHYQYERPAMIHALQRVGRLHRPCPRARPRSRQPRKDAEKQIEELLDRLIDASNRTVMLKLEERIEKLERQKLVLAEKAAKEMPTKARLEDCMELTLRFL